MHNICICGATWQAERHEDQCVECAKREDAIYANRPTREPLRRLFRKPTPEMNAPAYALPAPSHAPRMPNGGPVLTCACGHSGQIGFVSNPTWPKPLCESCARRAREFEISVRFATRRAS